MTIIELVKSLSVGGWLEGGGGLNPITVYPHPGLKLGWVVTKFKFKCTTIFNFQHLLNLFYVRLAVKILG